MPGYNKQQLSAISHIDGPMMVIAGPGCGKTAVIAGRVASLIRSGADPSSVLVVTFTKAASAEMRERFYALCENTFGKRYLSREHQAVNNSNTGNISINSKIYPDSNISDNSNASADSNDDQVNLPFEKINYKAVSFGTFHSIFFYILRQECRLDPHCVIGEDFKLDLLKELIEHSCEDPFWEYELAQETAREISYIKGNGISSENFYSNALPADAFRKVYGEYRRWLQENRRLDFDDIITAAYQLFRSNPQTLEKWQKRFKYILVDEFQDISPIQYFVVKMLAQPENNLFIVGDDDQSIYKFRGASPAVMLNFPKDYKDCRTVYLSQNYRSTPEIIEKASEVIRENEKRFPKRLFTENKNTGGVNIHIFENVWEEMDAVSLKVREAVKNGVSYENIAVLVRTNQGARPIIEKFIADRIPFYAQQAVPCLFDHFIAKDLIAYLDIGEGSRKKADFLRIINKPNRYITKNAFYENRVNFEMLYNYYDDREWMWERIEALEYGIEAIRQMPPYGAINYIRRIIGYDDYIRQYAVENKIPSAELMTTADEIMESARNFKTLAEWKAHINEFSESIKNKKTAGDEKNSVIISTLHGSKGKEYDIVFIIDVNDGTIPYHKATLPADIEEERRLFYVGMTRARYSLNIYAVKNRFEKSVEISPFLASLKMKYK